MPVRPARDESAFTLVELLVVLVLMGVVGGIVTNGLTTAMRTTRETQTRIDAMAELQRGAERISRELRAACPIVGTLAPHAVTAAIQRDGERLRHTYRFDAATGILSQDVVRDDAGTWTTVLDGHPLVQDLLDTGATFTYLDVDAEAAALARDVRTIRLVMRRDLPEQGPIEVETTVSLRNGGRSCD
jgi:prepilin-type N-terminal cleavage/methylation domain-containing protein